MGLGRVGVPLLIIVFWGVMAGVSSGWAIDDGDSDGYVYAWGDDSYGQLGDGVVRSPETNPLPAEVQGLPSTMRGTALAASSDHSLLVAWDGRAYGWGNDYHGQVGDGGDPNADPDPGVVVGLPEGSVLTDVAASSTSTYGHSLGLTDDGVVYAWGHNYYGLLGDGSYGFQTTRGPGPVALPAGTTVTAVATGRSHSLALASDGTVYAWGGSDGSGEHGDGTAGEPSGDEWGMPAPVVLPDTVTVIDVAAGSHSLALTDDGRVYAWGPDSTGQLGDGTVNDPDDNPVPALVDFPDGTVVTAIAAGASHSLALTADGVLYAWGSDLSGQLGDGAVGSPDREPDPTPVPLPEGTEVTVIAAGGDVSAALTADGTAYAWGDDRYGQLGDGTTGVPVDDPHPDVIAIPDGHVITDLAVGGRHMLALLSVDTDGDGVPDSRDVCPSVPDPDQTDQDGDGFGAACDPDDGDEPLDDDPRPDPGVTRLSGTDRIATAVEISKASFAPGVPVVYLATAANFPDALAVGSRAAADGAPVLLTWPDRLPAVAAQELLRLQPARVVILGGIGAVQPAVGDAVNALGDWTVNRLSGPDRYATAAAVAATFRANDVETVLVATGINFPDALAGGPWAGPDTPLLLTDPDVLPEVTRDTVIDLDPTQIVIAGGTGAVSTTVADQLAALVGGNVRRMAGADRFATAAAIANEYPAPTDVVYIATGFNFPDALAATSAAYLDGAPLLLTAPDVLPGPTRTALERLDPIQTIVLGGPNAVSPGVADQLGGLTRPSG